MRAPASPYVRLQAVVLPERDDVALGPRERARDRRDGRRAERVDGEVEPHESRAAADLGRDAREAVEVEPKLFQPDAAADPGWHRPDERAVVQVELGDLGSELADVVGQREARVVAQVDRAAAHLREVR